MRSLNSESIVCLEAGLGQEPLSVEQQLEKIRELRNSLAQHCFDSAEIDAFKREGRRWQLRIGLFLWLSRMWQSTGSPTSLERCESRKQPGSLQQMHGFAGLAEEVCCDVVEGGQLLAALLPRFCWPERAPVG